MLQILPLKCQEALEARADGRFFSCTVSINEKLRTGTKFQPIHIKIQEPRET